MFSQLGAAPFGTFFECLCTTLIAICFFKLTDFNRDGFPILKVSDELE